MSARLYKDYLAKKMADNSLINKKDYLIISNLGGDDADEVARVVEYINSNLDAWIAAVGEPAAYYVIEKNDERMLDLVKKGDESYKTYLEKIRTDYKKAYDVIKFKTVTPYQKSVDYYGALFAIYKNKDVPSTSSSCPATSMASAKTPTLLTTVSLLSPSTTLLARSSRPLTTSRLSLGSRRLSPTKRP